MIPNEIQQYPQWVNWRLEDDGAGKPTKVPYCTTSGMRASATDPKAWGTFENACAAMATGWYSGIGFVLADTDPYSIIDLDDPAGDPEIAERHGKVISMLDSYSEWSPSGKGMHIIVRGKVPGNRRRGKMELYTSQHYLTMTGATYLDKPIRDCTELLQLMYEDMGSDKIDVPVVASPQTKSDYELYEQAANAIQGDKFVALWNGDFQSYYTSQSEADFALINMLGFYSRNPEQIERMFMASGLGHRLATGQKKKAKKYIPEMIRRSFDNQLPDVDFTALTKAATIAKKKPSMRAKLDVDAPPALDFEMPPGLLGEITQFIYDAAPLPVKEVALAGALALLAGIVGRSYNVSQSGLNLYLLVLALTGTGKEAAAMNIGKLMDEVEKQVKGAHEFRGPSEIASGPALTKHLANNGPCCFSILGEFGLRLHQLCDENAQSHMVGLRRILLDLYHKSGKGGRLQPHVYSDNAKNTDIVYSPAYTILGESTPATFYRYLDDSMISDGLLPRFTVLEYTGDRVELNRNHTKVMPSPQLVTRMCELTTYCLQMQQAMRVLDVEFTPESDVLYEQLSSHYTRQINENRDNEVARQLLNRAHIKVMKLAALIAVGVNPIRPLITPEYIEWGRRIVDRDIANMLFKFAVGKVGRETGDLNQAGEVARCIAQYVARPYDATMSRYHVVKEMHQQNVIPYQYILRQCGSRAAFRNDKLGSTQAIKRAIETLQHEGGIREIKSHIMESQFGKTMKAYAIVDANLFT